MYAMENINPRLVRLDLEWKARQAREYAALMDFGAALARVAGSVQIVVRDSAGAVVSAASYPEPLPSIGPGETAYLRSNAAIVD
jgi:hypothetical protein